MAPERPTTQELERPLVNLTWDDCKARINELGIDREGAKVYGVPRGGLCAATLLERATIVHYPHQADVVLDDIIDSGATRELFAKELPERPFVALVDKLGADKGLGWVVFPWELHERPAEDGVVRLLQSIGEDVQREGLKDTPKRVVKALREMTDGYAMDPAAILARCFNEQADEMVVLDNIEFTSLCEHHMLPFSGHATVGYIPNEAVVGISKLVRLVDCFAHRLQVQERMTTQIAEALEKHLKPRGAGVVLKAHHSCMGCRGVRRPRSLMTTSSLAGLLKEDPRARAEFLSLANSKH